MAAVEERVASSSRQSAATADLLSYPLPDLGKLTTPASVRRSLAELSTHSAQLEDHLSQLLRESNLHKQAYRERVSRLSTQVDLIREEARVLQTRLGSTSSTAKRISESVRRLDEEIERVELARIWAEKVQDFKASLQSLASAIEQQDWDTATSHCVRCLEVPKNIVRSKFAAAVVPTSEYPEPPTITLLDLRKRLLDVFARRFTSATEARDTVEATKFFTLFPLIGWKAEGLEIYSDFARGIVRESGRNIVENLGSGRSGSPLHHATLLTQLFEHLALLIDQHQPLVDRHYGLGNFLEGVMPGLQEECDKLGGRVCDAWWEERSVRRRIQETRNYTFTYSASVGKTPKSLTKPTPASGPAAFSLPGRPSTPAGGGRGSASTSISAEPDIDTREVDRVNAEVAAMASRWGTYMLFLAGRLHLDNERGASNNENDGVSDGSHLQQQVKSASSIIKNSTLGAAIDEALEQAYLPLETWFLRCGIEKAHQLDQPDLGARPYTSPLLDDVFYLVKLVLERCSSTASLKVLSHMVRTVRWIVDEDFVQALARRMETTWRSSSSSMTVEGPRKEAATKEVRATFIVYLNVLSTSARYLERIIAEASSEQLLSQHYTTADASVASSTIHGLDVLVPRTRNAVRSSMELLFSQLTKPRLRQVLVEAYKDVSYLLDDDTFAEAEAHDLFVRRFIRGWDIVLAGFKEMFHEENWETYLRLCVDSIVMPWEKQAMSMQYSELGAIRFDKDLRALSSHLSNQSTTGGLREKFARLTHISYLVNLVDDNDDSTAEDGGFAATQAREAQSDSNTGSDVAWRLSAQEVKIVRGRRAGW